MLNGNILKICFLLIVATFCLILMGLTIGVGFKRIEIPIYVQLLGELGISGLFGSIIQAFIHSNIAEAKSPIIEGINPNIIKTKEIPTEGTT